MKIGMLIAIQKEIDAFMSEYEGKYSKESLSGFDVYKVDNGKNQVFAIHSGAGQVFAAAATMLLIDRFEVEMIINYGIVGALREGLSAKDTCVVEKIVHYCFDTSEIDGCEVGRHLEYDSIFIPTDKKLMETALELDKDLKVVTCASGERFIDDVQEKLALGREFKSDICEMEAAAIQLIADRNGVPCLFLKAVSDSLYGGAEEYDNLIEDTSSVCAKMGKAFLDMKS